MLLTMDPTLHCEMMTRVDDELVTEPVTGLQHRNIQFSTLVVNIETDVQS